MSNRLTEALDKGDYINSYFIGFDATGVPTIDAILVAVARAGKAYHSTEFWNDEGLNGGPSHNDLIQAAADTAAAAARAYSEGEDIWWCEVHDASAVASDGFCERHAVLHDELGMEPRVFCRMVSRRVCPTVKEEEK